MCSSEPWSEHLKLSPVVRGPVQAGGCLTLDSHTGQAVNVWHANLEATGGKIN